MIRAQNKIKNNNIHLVIPTLDGCLYILFSSCLLEDNSFYGQACHDQHYKF